MSDATQRDRRRALAESIERWIDTSPDVAAGCAEIIEAVAEVCRGKAEHLRQNWQDHDAARVWDRLAARVDKAAAMIAKVIL